ncbi:hypothetical protein NLG97_g5564 [Lecanicillium saksenae]|uniref:Uncharacterized protein n=1 Tax=Lecanicillium saksenae TaxID=468837 RepID=A0ACC1QV97_9HYPO|nr:hypothetical protein NLG97_g5564 [Lecanicillium saksenae]
MHALIDTPFGQLVRRLSKRSMFLYPEERADFVVPATYSTRDAKAASTSTTPTNTSSCDANKNNGIPFSDALNAKASLDVENTSFMAAMTPPEVDDVILVDCLYTFAVYGGSAIYVPAELQVMVEFHVGPTASELGLALYVLGYGIGPLFWSPMSELAKFGRNVPYISTFFVFVILCIPTSLVTNFAGFLVLRFLLGFFGSPCLANGGASMQDLYSWTHLPLGLTGWVAAAYCGPALGPLLSSYALTVEDWRWSMWEVLWMSGPIFAVMCFFLPETSEANILLRRAQRLRKLTGNTKLLSRSEVRERGLTFGSVFFDAVIKPIEIMIKDPAVLFTNIYTSLVYGIYYSFFEVFPLVYPPIYGFTAGLTGTTFVCIIVGCLMGVVIYVSYQVFYLIPAIERDGLQVQEHRLVPALFAVFGTTMSLFLFAWTARSSVHWIVGVIGIALYAGSSFIVFQAISVYIPLSYPQYSASLFAGNDFSRSTFAFASVLFSRTMYLKLGIAKGVSLLGGLSILGIRRETVASTTLDKTEELTGRNTLFGRVAGDTIYNLTKIGESEVAQGIERPLYGVKIETIELQVNPFEDMKKRTRIATRITMKPAEKEQRKKREVGGKQLLSFGDEEGEDEEILLLKKPKFDMRLIADEEPEKPVVETVEYKKLIVINYNDEDDDEDDDMDNVLESLQKTALELANEEMAAIEASMRRKV